MRDINLSDYPNLLDNITISDFDILLQIRDYKLNFPQIRNEKVEWQMELPMFVIPFYSYVVLNKSVPSQEEYWNFYLLENAEFFVKNNLAEEIMEGIKCRVFRTYPSLVRDIHFALFLKNRMKNYKIIYNTKLDVEEGIDLLLINGEDRKAVNCFTDTEIARKGRVKKQYKHDNFNGIKYIDLPVEVGGAKSCGDFYLYGLTQMNELNELIK